VIALYRILLRTSVTRGRLLAFLAAGALLDLIAYSIRVSDYINREVDTFNMLDVAALALYVPVVALVFSTSSLGDLASDGTLVYIWLRPVARWKVVLVALAATLTVTLPLTLIPSGLAVVLAGASWQLLWATTAATALGTCAYVALFTGLGLRVRHALIYGLGYVVIWEASIASIGKGPATISIRHYAESVLSHLANPTVGIGYSNLVDLLPAIVVLAAVTAVGFVLTTVLLARQDVA
jgi:ABC-2 type transport system permease protein